MSDTPKKTDSIKMACINLEEALSQFESETGDQARAEEQKRIQDMKETLEKIRKQLEELS